MAISSRNTSQILTASHYNEIRNQVVKVLGTGTGNYGYGQPTVSSTRASGSHLVSSVDMQNLRKDIMRAYVHQQGAAVPLDVPTANTNVARAGATSDADYRETHNAYIAVANSIETNRLSAHSGQMTLLPGARSKSISNWGQGTVSGGSHTATISHTISFTSANHRRWFFNAGGQIRLYMSHSYSGTSAKAEDWKRFLANSVNNRVPINYDIFIQLTTSYKSFYQRNAGGYRSVYADNYWYLQARLNGNNIQITQYYVDADVGWINRFWIAAYDEPVIGTTSSSIGVYYPTGSTTDAVHGASATVQLSAPTIS